MQNNPVVTPEMMRAGNIAYSKGESVEAIYLAMTQASPPPDEMVMRMAAAIREHMFPLEHFTLTKPDVVRSENAARAALQSIGPLMRERDEVVEALQGLADAVADEANAEFGISGRVGARLSDAREALKSIGIEGQG